MKESIAGHEDREGAPRPTMLSRSPVAGVQLPQTQQLQGDKISSPIWPGEGLGAPAVALWTPPPRRQLCRALGLHSESSQLFLLVLHSSPLPGA